MANAKASASALAVERAAAVPPLTLTMAAATAFSKSLRAIATADAKELACTMIEPGPICVAEDLDDELELPPASLLALEDVPEEALLLC